jgi:hypothetical protein
VGLDVIQVAGDGGGGVVLGGRELRLRRVRRKKEDRMRASAILTRSG